MICEMMKAFQESCAFLPSSAIRAGAESLCTVSDVEWDNNHFELEAFQIACPCESRDRGDKDLVTELAQLISSRWQVVVERVED